MDLILPKVGLVFWMLVFFLTFFFLLRKFAWKPIMKGIHDREESIRNSLEEAQKAREEMERLQSDNQKILQEARAERERIIKESQEIGTNIVDEAKKEANEEAKRIVESARRDIEAEKRQALSDIKKEVGQLSIEVAERILRTELKDSAEQEKLVNQLISDLQPN